MVGRQVLALAIGVRVPASEQVIYLLIWVVFWQNKLMKKIENNFAFIDGQNLNLGIQELGWKLDFSRFRHYLKEKYAVKTAYYFIGYVSGNQDLYSYLQKAGYVLIFKPTIPDNNGKIKGKPDPQIYQLALSVIGKQPKDVIVFEDAIAGLQSAKNAQAGKIIVVNSNDDDYSDWKDCQIIKNFNEVDRTQFVK